MLKLLVVVGQEAVGPRVPPAEKNVRFVVLIPKQFNFISLCILSHTDDPRYIRQIRPKKRTHITNSHIMNFVYYHKFNSCICNLVSCIYANPQIKSSHAMRPSVF